jgi:hypothetical protein
MSPTIGDRKNCVNCDSRMTAVYTRTSNDAAFRNPSGGDAHPDRQPEAFGWLCDECGFPEAAPRLKMEPDPDSSDRWIVTDGNDAYVGDISFINVGQYLSSYPREADGKPDPVRPGPYETLEAAFEAFQRGL